MASACTVTASAAATAATTTGTTTGTTTVTTTTGTTPMTSTAPDATSLRAPAIYKQDVFSSRIHTSVFKGNLGFVLYPSLRLITQIFQKYT
jgi:hypothetical protein